MKIEPLPSISAIWKTRLHGALDSLLAWSERDCGSETIIAGSSRNARTLLELTERDGMLMRSSLQLALPDEDDLETLKLGCWTLLYLKSLFPEWSNVDVWVKEAADWATGARGPIHKHLRGYRVACWYNPVARVIDFQVSKR